LLLTSKALSSYANLSPPAKAAPLPEKQRRKRDFSFIPAFLDPLMAQNFQNAAELRMTQPAKYLTFSAIFS